MSNNLNVLLIGAGYMGKEYGKVLNDLDVQYSVVCRSDSSAIKFNEELGVMPISGGIENALKQINFIPDAAIVAVNVEFLSSTVIALLNYGIKEILVEKPAGLNKNEILKVCETSNSVGAKVYVAYNRRFYSSTEKALEIISNDGGVSSFNFEFTEWGFKIEKTSHAPEVKENWLLANSTHVIDLAFFLGGFPKEMCSFSSGSLEWHSRASKYAGAGVTDNGALFSYQANWDAPGRWAVEILTNEHRLYFRPMEELAIQKKGSVNVENVEIDDKIDIDFKPGLYKQVEAFLLGKNDDRLITIEEQIKHLDFYEKIDGI
ncbi:MAG: Gfo/Idh/MocA family oxidoreductase [Methanobrevibacter sp.]|nr:Gfo/Idh/MocA family oxidoreductase [Methanobrevibacter sp.]